MDRDKQDGVFGQQQASSGNNDFNSLMFVINQVMSQMNTATLVKVVAVHTTGRTAAVGTVDVLPLVSQTDGYGDPIPHTTIFGLPFLRLQGGSSAVICDPVVGDLGFCIFASHDLTSVKESGTPQAPESQRRFDMADGMFIGGWNLNVAPVHYIVIDAAGITIEAGSTPASLHASGLTINAPVTINGDITHTGKLHSTGDATFDKKVTAAQDVIGGPLATSLANHKHVGVTVGSGITGSAI